MYEETLDFQKNNLQRVRPLSEDEVEQSLASRPLTKIAKLRLPFHPFVNAKSDNPGDRFQLLKQKDVMKLLTNEFVHETFMHWINHAEVFGIKSKNVDNIRFLATQNIMTNFLAANKIQVDEKWHTTPVMDEKTYYQVNSLLGIQYYIFPYKLNIRNKYAASLQMAHTVVVNLW